MTMDKGYVKIASEADRVAVAAILYKNGYSVTPKRRKAGSKFEYLLFYEVKPITIQEDVAGDG